MKPIAWYDPSNGMVSTDQDCPLFTPLGQVWALYLEREWVGLTEEEVLDMARTFGAQPWPPYSIAALEKMIEAKLKEKNTWPT